MIQFSGEGDHTNIDEPTIGLNYQDKMDRAKIAYAHVRRWGKKNDDPNRDADVNKARNRRTDHLHAHTEIKNLRQQKMQDKQNYRNETASKNADYHKKHDEIRNNEGRRKFERSKRYENEQGYNNKSQDYGNRQQNGRNEQQRQNRGEYDHADQNDMNGGPRAHAQHASSRRDKMHRGPENEDHRPQNRQHNADDEDRYSHLPHSSQGESQQYRHEMKYDEENELKKLERSMRVNDSEKHATLYPSPPRNEFVVDNVYLV